MKGTRNVKKTKGKHSMVDKNFVTYKGIRMARGWPAQIRAAQLMTTIPIGGREVTRVRYGDESRDWGADCQPCDDCRVLKGQFHVMGCDIEQCPRCAGQAITCNCPYDTDPKI
jgi:hypothetical protein